MKKIISFSTLALLAVIVFSCKKESAQFLDMYAETVAIGAAGGEVYTTVFSNRQFAATTSASWCRAEPAEDRAGQMNNLKILVDPNEETAARTAEITIVAGGENIVIRLNQRNCPYITATGETLVEAENNEEGISAMERADWWVTHCEMFCQEYYIMANAVSYLVTFEEAGQYDFDLAVANYADPIFVNLYVDGVLAGVSSIPKTDAVHINHVQIRNVTLTSGMHLLRVVFETAVLFDKITVTANDGSDPGDNPNVIAPDRVCTIEAETAQEQPGLDDPSGWAYTAFEQGAGLVNNNTFTYKVYVTEAGYYDFDLNAVSWESDNNIALKLDGTQLAVVSVNSANAPGFWGSPDWDHVRFNNVALSAGVHTINFTGLKFFVFNKFTVKAAGYNEYDGPNKITVATPLVIEAETAQEQGLLDGSWGASAFEPGAVLVNINTVTYTVYVEEAGDYDFDLNAVSWENNNSIALKLDGTQLALVPFGGYADEPGFWGSPDWDHVRFNSVALPAGVHTINFTGSNYFVFNKFTVRAKYDGPNRITAATPLVIEAETAQEGYTNNESAPGAWMDWVFPGEFSVWGANFTYQVYVEDAGNYDFTLYVVSWGDVNVAVKIDGTTVATGTIYNTGEEPNWTTIGTLLEINSISLPTGTHTLKFEGDGGTHSGGFGFDKLSITAN